MFFGQFLMLCRPTLVTQAFHPSLIERSFMNGRIQILTLSEKDRLASIK